MWPAQFCHFSKAGQPFRVAAHYIASQHQDDFGFGKACPGGTLFAETGKIARFHLRGLEGSPVRFLPMKTLKRFFLDQSGATSIEYAIIAAGLSIVILVAVNGIGSALNGKYEMIRAAVQ